MMWCGIVGGWCIGCSLVMLKGIGGMVVWFDVRLYGMRWNSVS